MKDKKAAWQRGFEAFAGRGIRHPSEMMRVTDGEARALRAGLAALDWEAPAYVGSGRHAGYTVCNAKQKCATALFHASTLAGIYAGSYLWIAPAHRGRGLSTPLILAAAAQRGGGILPPGIVLQGYTAAGVAAHRSAHRQAVLTALADGLPVPAAVLEEMRRDGADLQRAA